MNLITWKWNFDYKIRYEEQCFSLPFLWIFQYKKVFFLKSNFLYTTDVSRNEESHVSVTTSLFMALILLEMLNCGFFFHLLKILHKQLFLSKFQCSRNNFPKQNINFVLIDVIKMKVCYFKSNLVTNPIWTVASKCIKLHLYFYSMLPVKCQSVFHSSYKNYTSFSVLFGFSDNVKEKYLSFTLSRKVVWGFFHEWND